MQIKIIKDIEPQGSEPLVFIANVEGKSCEDAKQIAQISDAVFELDLKDQDDMISKDVDFEAIMKILDLDDSTKKSMRDIYNSSNLIGSGKNMIRISQLSISCSGRIKITITAPEFDPSVNIGTPNSSNLKLGLGFTFKSKTFPNYFLVENMTC